MIATRSLYTLLGVFTAWSIFSGKHYTTLLKLLALWLFKMLYYLFVINGSTFSDHVQRSLGLKIVVFGCILNDENNTSSCLTKFALTVLLAKHRLVY